MLGYPIINGRPEAHTICDVCGEIMLYAKRGFIICDKCKQAIMAMRKQLEEEK